MCKRIFLTVCAIWILFVLFSAQIEAAAHKPEITGNYEQGWRLYESEEGNGDDYFFQEAWLKWKHDFTSQSYYYVRGQYHANNFTHDNRLDSQTIDLLFNYTRQLSKPLRLKTEVNLRNKLYPNDRQKPDGTIDPALPEKDYYAVQGNVELTVRPWTGDAFYYGAKLQYEMYPHNDKENWLAGMNLRWEHTFSDQLKVHTGCNITKEDYFYSTGSDKMRYAISFGFEYQL